MELSIAPLKFGLCSPEFEYPQITDVSVVASDGASLPVDEILPGAGLVGRTRIELSNVPPGGYRLLRTATPDPATNKPSVTVEAFFHVAQDRRDAGVEVLPFACADLDRTVHGAWVCDNAVLRDGMVFETLPEGWRYATSGTAIWGVAEGGQEVSRWEDHGSGPLERQTLKGPADAGTPPSQVQMLVPSESELLLRWRTTVERYDASADGGNVQRTFTFVAPAGRALSRSGDAILLDDETTDFNAPEICLYTLGDAGLERSSATCAVASTVIQGSDERGLWAYDEGLIVYSPLNGAVSSRNELPRLFGLGVYGSMAGSRRASPGFQATSIGSISEESTFSAVVEHTDGGAATLTIYEGPGPLLGVRAEFLWGEVLDAGIPSTWVIQR